MNRTPIIIVGAGLSGLSAAFELEAAGESCFIIDEAAHIGGKLETTLVEGSYLLDRGFQVLLPSYPELQRLNILEELDLHYFASGARLETIKGPIKMADPFRHPENILSTAFGSYGSLRDKMLVYKLQRAVMNGDSESLFSQDSRPTIEFLRNFGFSEKMISNFWKPFFSGIFLEKDLKTSAGFFLYLVRMFATSAVAVPKKGIGALPQCMAKRLKHSEILLETKVKFVDEHKIELPGGRILESRGVLKTMPLAKAAFGQVTSFWFAAPKAPYSGPWLSIQSHEKPSLINHTAVMSNVCPNYATKGDALICVSAVRLIGRSEIPQILAEARELYGKTVEEWRLLRVDCVEQAFPLYLNRQDKDTPSQQGALQRGRQAAKALLARLNN